MVAFWLVAYSLLVFGTEVAFRGFQRKRFHPRSRFTVPICWSIVLAMLLATWIPSQTSKNPRNECSASLLSWVMPWADIALFLNSILLFLYLLTGFLIHYQLSRTAKIDRNERIAASRTVYYLAIGVVLMVCDSCSAILPKANGMAKSSVLPFWALVVQGKSTINAGPVATTALNIFGLLTGLLYLILRSNSSNMAFRPKAASWEDKQEWRLFRSPDLDIGKHLTNPVAPERSGTMQEVVFASKEARQLEAHKNRSRDPSGSTADHKNRSRDPSVSTAAHEKATIRSSPPSYRTPSKSTISKPSLSSPPSYRAPPIPTASDPLLMSPPTFQIPQKMLDFEPTHQSFNHAQYTLFPQHPIPAPGSSTDRVDALPRKAANLPAPPFSNGHKRNTSDVSTATVQIGMRLSTVTAKPGAEELISRTVTYPPVTDSSQMQHGRHQPPLLQRSLDGLSRSLGPPIQLQTRPRDSSPHEILFRLNSNEELSHEPVQIFAPLRAQPLEDLVSPTRRISSWRRFRDARMKSLPPVPVTPSMIEPPSSHRASFPEPRTPSSPSGPMRASQEREALSLALKEDEHWPLKGISPLLLPDKSYIPDKNRSWI